MNKPDVVTPAQYKDLLTLIDSKIKKANLKETKKESRNTAELDIVEDTIIQVDESQ